MLHSPVGLNPVHRQILRRLDGEHDLDSLVNCLEEDVRSGELKIESDGAELDNQEQQRAALKTVVRDALDQFARMALLVN